LTVLLIRADGSEHVVDGHLTMESLSFLIGGTPYHRPLSDGRHMFVDLDGHDHGRKFNMKATQLFSTSWEHILGDVLILNADEYTRLGFNVREFRGKQL
jgi:hypothetical protein